MASPTFSLTDILIRGRQTNSQVIVSGVPSRREKKNRDAWSQVNLSLIYQAFIIAAQLQVNKSLQRWCKLSVSQRYFSSNDFLPSLLGLCCRMSLEWLTYLIIRLAPWAGKMIHILLCNWLPERAKWRSGLPDVFRRKNHPGSLIIKPSLNKLARSRWLVIALILVWEFMDLNFFSVLEIAK